MGAKQKEDRKASVNADFPIFFITLSCLKVPERLVSRLAPTHAITLGLNAGLPTRALFLGGTLVEQGPGSLGALAAAHAVAGNVDAAVLGRIGVRAPVCLHGAADRLARLDVLFLAYAGAVFGRVGDVVIVEALALVFVARFAFDGACALPLGCTIVVEFKVRIRIRAGLVHYWAADGRDIVL